MCGRLNIADAYLDTDRLYRMVFSFDNLQIETNGDVSTYSTTFYTMGIVPSPKENLLVGQGILQIAVKASVPKPGDNKTLLKRFFYAAGNPRQTLVDAQLIEQRENGKSYLRYQENR